MVLSQSVVPTIVINMYIVMMLCVVMIVDVVIHLV
jgi:hypothetical protein